MAPTVEYRDDDDGYLTWLANHPHGFVINIQRNYRAADARVHLAACGEINGQKFPGKALTSSYVKRCAEYLHDLTAWAGETVRREIQPCGRCRPTTLFPKAEPAATDSSPGTDETAADPFPAPETRDGHFVVRGPTADGRHVAVWADDYIRFERRPPWQDDLRTQIRNRCQELQPGTDEVLHATFFGAKHPRADVENLVLYNIDTFRAAGRHGIRFEHGDLLPHGPDGVRYPFGYRYSLAPRDSTFDYWQPGRQLASFGWVEAGEPNRTPSLAQIWLALSRHPGRSYGLVRSPDAPYGLHMEIRPPRGQRPVWGGLVKTFFDGVICAHQAHTDIADLPVVAERIASALGADREEIAELLLDRRNAAIGAVHQLVKPFRTGIQWHPSDEACVAGEVLAAAPPDGPGCVEDARWGIRGRLVELMPMARAPR